MKKSFIPIGFIILTSAFFRLYNFIHLFHWSMDEEYWAYLARNVAIGEHIPLIGGNVGGTGFHTTPWLVYLLGIISKFVSGNPFGLGMAMAILGVLTTFLIYLLGKEMIGRKAASIAAFLYGFSASAAFADRRFWNPSVIPVLTLVTIYSLWRINKKNDIASFLFLAISLSLFFASHGLAIIFLAVSVAILVMIRKRIRVSNLLIGTTIILFSLAPLFLFEVKHNFVQTRRFLENQQSTPLSLSRAPESLSLALSTASRFYYYPKDYDIQLTQTYGCKSYPSVRPHSVLPTIFALSALLFVLTQVVRRKFVFILLGLVTVILVGSLIFWPEGLRGYYLYPIYIVLALASGSLISTVSKNPILKVIFVIGLGAIFFLNLQKIIFSYHSDSYDKKLTSITEAITLSRQMPFSFAVQASDLCRSYGYRYTFSFLGVEPEKSYMDPYFLWLYEGRLGKNHPQNDIILKLNNAKREFVVTPSTRK